MKNKLYISCAILALILVGLFSYNKFLTGNRVKNSETMKSDSKVSIIKEEVEYFPGAKGYFVRPKAPGNYPGVVMIHENRGLRPEIRDIAETLAKEGYLVLAVDLLGGVAEDQDGARALTSKFNQATGTKNMRTAVAYLKDRGATKIGSLGWCFGGRQSVALSISGENLMRRLCIMEVTWPQVRNN